MPVPAVPIADRVLSIIELVLKNFMSPEARQRADQRSKNKDVIAALEQCEEFFINFDIDWLDAMFNEIEISKEASKKWTKKKALYRKTKKLFFTRIKPDVD